MRISDWSSDVCSSDLFPHAGIIEQRKVRLDLPVYGYPEGAQRSRVDVHFHDDLGRDRKSTRLTPVTNAHLVCRLLLEKNNKATFQLKYISSRASTHSTQHLHSERPTNETTHTRYN